jgi:hypothetical protein
LHRTVYLTGVLRKWRNLSAIGFLLYSVSYIVFSSCGEYVLNNHGGQDWRHEWCPKHLVYPYMAFSGRTRTAFSPLGNLYCPLIFIDRIFWHRTVWDD